MSAYDRDPRVQKVDDNFYYVAAPCDIFIGGVRSAPVWPNQEDGGWAADLSGREGISTHPTVDEAIHSLIGDPA